MLKSNQFGYICRKANEKTFFTLTQANGYDENMECFVLFHAF